MFNERGHHFIRISDVAYPLDQSDGTVTGYANQRTIQIYAPLGYTPSDLVATLEPSRHGSEQAARTMAAALSGCPVEEIEVDHRFWYRTGRNASTPTETGVRFTPACRISRREHSALVNHRNDTPEILVAISRALASPHRSTVEALDESQGGE